MKTKSSDPATSGGRQATKRIRTRQQILAYAIALFRERGIRTTRLAEIARASGVVAATLYNHFPTKAALVEAWIRGEIDAALAEALREAGVDHPLRPSLRRLCRVLAETSAAEPALRSEAWRIVARARDPVHDPPARLVASLLAEQRAGRVRSDLPPERLATMILDALEGGLVAGLAELGDEAGDSASSRAHEPGRRLGAALQASIDLVLDGARKRNERVRPPRRST